MTEFEVLMLEKMGNFEKQFESIDKRFDSIDKRLDGMDKRFEDIENRLDVMQADIDEIKEDAHITRGALNSIIDTLQSTGIIR